MPSERFTHSAVAEADSTTIWASLNKPETWESISGIDKIIDPAIDDEGRLTGFSFDTMVAGSPYRGVAAQSRRDEGRLMAWAIENSEITGAISVELTPSGGETTLEVTLDVESKGMLSRMFFPVVARTIGGGLPRSVEEFAAGFG